MDFDGFLHKISIFFHYTEDGSTQERSFSMFAFCNRLFGGYGWSEMWWIGGIAMFIGLILIGVVIYLLVSNSRRSAGGNISEAADILKERLAKGEIDEDTYEQLLKKINKT